MISYKNAWHFLTESKWFWTFYLKMNFDNKKSVYYNWDFFLILFFLFRTYTMMVTISNAWLTCQRIKCVEWEITCKMHNLLFRIVILLWGQTNKFAFCTWFRNITKLKNLKTKCLKMFSISYTPSYWKAI